MARRRSTLWSSLLSRPWPPWQRTGRKADRRRRAAEGRGEKFPLAPARLVQALPPRLGPPGDQTAPIPGAKRGSCVGTTARNSRYRHDCNISTSAQENFPTLPTRLPPLGTHLPYVFTDPLSLHGWNTRPESQRHTAHTQAGRQIACEPTHTRTRARTHARTRQPPTPPYPSGSALPLCTRAQGSTQVNSWDAHPWTASGHPTLRPALLALPGSLHAWLLSQVSRMPG